jgi:hypothetical protein
MYLTPAEAPAYRTFLELNRLFWRSSNSSLNSPTSVYVDLFHDNAEYLHRNLSCGALISQKFGMPLVGLTGLVGVVGRSCPSYNPDRVTEMALSYHAEVLPTLPQPDCGLLVQEIARVYRTDDGLSLSGDALRQLLTRWCLEDGFPIGRYIYDTYIRSSLVETVETWSTALLEVAAEVLNLHSALSLYFEGRAPAWLVTGHLDYAPFGLAAHAVLLRAGTVAFIRPEKLPSVQFIRGVPSAGQSLHGRYRAGSTDIHNDVLDHAISALRPTVDNHFSLLSSKMFYRSNRASLIPTPELGASAGLDAKKLLRSALGWPIERRCITIFTITTADIPLADEQIYSDNYQWLCACLSLASEHPECSWLVKVHPHEQHFNRTRAIERLEKQYSGFPNIRFAYSDWTPLAAFLIADIVTTVRGSPGVEAAALGKKVIVSGAGPYSDLGFVTRAHSHEEYCRLLLDECPDVDGDDNAVRARAYLYAEDAIFGYQSALLPAFGFAGQAADFWSRLSSTLSWFVRESDVFCTDLGEAINNRRSRMMRKVPQIHREPVLPPMSEQPSVRPTDQIDFRTGHVMHAIPLFGFYIRESWGIWVKPPVAHLLAPYHQPVASCLRLNMTCLSLFGHRTTLALTLGGISILREIETEQPRQVCFDFPSGTYSVDGYLYLTLQVGLGISPSSRTATEDDRALSVGLVSLTISPVD